MVGMVVTLGSLMTDLVGYAARLPSPGESLPGRDFQTFLGGKGCNQAVAARRSGAPVALIGRVGADAYGEAFFPALATEGIDATHVTVSPDAGSGVALILIGADSGQNMILALPRANLTVTPEQTIAALDALLSPATLPNPTAIFLAQLETNVPAVEAGLRHARTLGMTTILNTAPIPPEPLDPSVFALVDVLVANEVEAGALTGLAVGDPDAALLAAQALLERGVGGAIVTLGAQGAVWAARPTSPLGTHAAVGGSGADKHADMDAVTRVEGEALVGRLAPIAVRPVDATAAGDAFCGALAAALASGLPGDVALRRANAAGALAVTRRGALPSLPTAAEIDALLVSLDAAGDMMGTTTV